MERRREARQQDDWPAQLTVLDKPPGILPGVVVNVSGWGLGVMLAGPVAAGAPVRVDAGGSIFLGEVCYCRPERGQYAVGIAIEQTLRMTDELVELRNAILCGR